MFVNLGVMARNWGTWRLRWAVLPLIAFAVLVFGFLPAHQLSSHHAPTAGSSAVAVQEREHVSASVSADEAASHGHAAHAQAPSGHHSGEGPFCHDGTASAYVLSARCVLPDWGELLASVALALAGGYLALTARTAGTIQSWRSRPWWRLSGISLLTAVCVSRT